MNIIGQTSIKRACKCTSIIKYLCIGIYVSGCMYVIWKKKHSSGIKFPIKIIGIKNHHLINCSSLNITTI